MEKQNKNKTALEKLLVLCSSYIVRICVSATLTLHNKGIKKKTNYLF
jgi:hypothetical protein